MVHRLMEGGEQTHLHEEIQSVSGGGPVRSKADRDSRFEKLPDRSDAFACFCVGTDTVADRNSAGSQQSDILFGQMNAVGRQETAAQYSCCF